MNRIRGVRIQVTADDPVDARATSGLTHAYLGGRPGAEGTADDAPSICMYAATADWPTIYRKLGEALTAAGVDLDGKP